MQATMGTHQGAGILHWTDEMRKRTHGRRNFWHGPLEIDERGVLERLADPENRKWLGKFRFEEDCAAYRQRILDTAPDRLYSLEDDPRFEGVRAATYRLGYTYNVVPYWCREKGVAFALEALIWQQRVYYTNFWVRMDHEREHLDLDMWGALRNGVAAAAADDFEKALLVAERFRSRDLGPREQVFRLGISYAFPDRAEWALDDAREQLAARGMDRHAICLLGSVKDPEVLLPLAKRIVKMPADDWVAKTWDQYVPDLVANLGADSWPILRTLFDGARRAGHKQAVVDCLALFETVEAAGFFVHHLADRHVAKVGAAYLTRNLPLFLGAMASLSSPPQTATGLLAQIRHREPARVQSAELEQARDTSAAAMPSESGSAAAGGGAATGESVAAGGGAATGGGAAAGAGAVPEAALDELPPLLARPPWMGKAKRKPIVVDLPDLLAAPEHVEWNGERPEDLLTPRDYRDCRLDLGTPTPERDVQVQAWLDAIRKQERPPALTDMPNLQFVREWSTFTTALMAMTQEGARAMLAPRADSSDLRVHYGSFLPLFARLEMAPLPLLIHLVLDSNPFLSDSLLPELLRVISPRTGQAMGKLAWGRKSQRNPARAWLQRHPELGAMGIIPVAVGPTGSDRTRAETALRWMARAGHGEIIEAVAVRYGPRALEAVHEILASDLGFDKVPRLPSFWTPDAWPSPVLASSGRALPRPALESLGIMLAVSTLDEPHYGLETVRGACTPGSLAAFGESLFDAWLVAGMPATQAWAYHALAPLGDEGTVRKLVGHLNKWPTEGAGGRTRTMTGLEILATQGSDLALLHVQRMSQTARIRALQEKAATTLEEAARARGLALAQLEDRLVPTLGLDERGTVRLDFGPRAFEVRFDEQLQPFVVDSHGTRLPQFPRANRDDDAAKACAASEQWKQLRDDVNSLAGTQVRRLEQAMCQMRRWPVQDFDRFLLRHPLMRHLAQRLVWATFGADHRPIVLFRVAEDGTLADSNDEPLTLPESAILGIPHRLELSDEQAQAWGTLLADYTIVQPFAQVGRDTYAPGPEEEARDTLARPDVHTKGGRLRGLLLRGWRMYVDSTWVHMLEKNLDDGIRLTLDFQPGWDVSAPSDSEQAAHPVHSSVPLGQLPPVIYSEMVRDYMWLSS